MTPEQKKKIDNMDYESMLGIWRFTPSESHVFKGEWGDYFIQIMEEKKADIGDAAAVAASKNVGWNR